MKISSAFAIFSLKTGMKKACFSKKSWLLLLIFSLLINMNQLQAVSHFDRSVKPNKKPILFKPEDVWFFDTDMSKVIPEINRAWITIVFPFPQKDKDTMISQKEIESSGDVFSEMAMDIVNDYDVLIDFLCDINLAENACFFQITGSLLESAFWKLIREINDDQRVLYAQPTLQIKEKTFAFFNAIELKFKTGATSEEKKRLLTKLHIVAAGQNGMYKVNVSEISFFKAINLLAEDVLVAEVAPYLVELRPSIEAIFTIPINGGNIGDRIPFSMKISFSDRVRIEPSSLANINIRPREVSQNLFNVIFTPYDHVQVTQQSPIYITGSMFFYAPGEFTLPPIPVKYNCIDCFDTKIKSIETNSVVFKVSSLIPSQQRENTLLIPMKNIPLDIDLEATHHKGIIYLVTSIFSFLVALVCLGVIVTSRRNQQRPSEEQSREQIYADQLKSQLSVTPANSHWSHVIEISRIFRQYLAAKYQVSQDPLGGSGRIFFSRIEHKFPEESAPELLALLTEIDDIVAFEREHYPGLERFQTRVMQFIDAAPSPS